MNYNVYYAADFSHSILDINTEKLNIVLSAYSEGNNEFTIGGKKYNWGHLTELIIFTNANEYSPDKLIALAARNGYLVNGYEKYVSKKMLAKLGEDVTSNFIGNRVFGEYKDEKVIQASYIDQSRIEAFRALKTPYDLSKLIRLCEELNDSYYRGNFYSVAMLGRAIIDHVPMIFEYKTFNEVSNNYGGKSVKGSLKHLNESMRNISDGFLHSNVRKIESLPNAKQVNFSQDLDVLLGEIIVFSKNSYS